MSKVALHITHPHGSETQHLLGQGPGLYSCTSAWILPTMGNAENKSSNLTPLKEDLTLMATAEC